MLYYVENYANVSCIIFIVLLTFLSWLHQENKKATRGERV